MVSLIFLRKKNSLKIKIEIYYQTIKVIIKSIFKFFFLYGRWLRIRLEKAVIETLLMININENIWQCHPIIIDINIDYKKEVVIISIKSRI